MRNDLDIWAIQHYPEAIDTALANIDKYGDIIIYSNARTQIKIGTQYLSGREFNTIIESKNNDILIMIMKNCEDATKRLDVYKEKLSTLENKSVYYNEIIFKEAKEEYFEDKQIKELWFVRDKIVLEEALLDSHLKNISTGEYYPFVYGFMNIYYMNTYNEPVNFDGRLFKGVIEDEDKIILLIDNNFNLTPSIVYNICKDKAFKLNVRYQGEPTLRVSYEYQKKYIMK